MNSPKLITAFVFLALSISASPVIADLTDPYDGNYSLFWGDIHCHSNLSDGVPLIEPEEELRRARDVEDLDFAALSDHAGWCFINLHYYLGMGFAIYSEETAQEKWNTIVDLTREFYEPGRFVTLAGYEWSSTSGKGHRNLYFESDGSNVGLAPLGGFYHSLSSYGEGEIPDHSPFIWPDIPETYDRSDPPSLWESLEADGFTIPGNRVILIPHHSAWNAMIDWDLYRNDSLERLVEVYSKHGCSEFEGCYHGVKPDGDPNWAGAVVNALASGHRLGLLAGTDAHGHFWLNGPGSNKPAYPGSVSFAEHDWRDDIYGKELGWRQFGGGIAGMWAQEHGSLEETLTREGIFSAMYDRRVLGTSGPRLDIRFWFDSDGDFDTIDDTVLMGEETPSTSGELLNFGVKIAFPGSAVDSMSIDRVRIMKNGIETDSFDYQDGTREVELTWFDVKDWGELSYYIAVHLDDPLNFDNDARYDSLSGLPVPEYEERAWSSPIFFNEGILEKAGNFFPAGIRR